MAPPQMSFRAFTGIGMENVSAYGTPVARTKFARCIEATVEAKHGGQVSKTSRLSSSEDAVLGEYDVGVGLRGEMRPETIGSFLRAHAGDASVTSTQPSVGPDPTVWQHVINHKDTRQPLTWERRLGTLSKSEVVQGVVLEEVGFEFQKDLVMFTAKGIGQKDVLSSSPTVPTFDTKAPMARHQAVLTIAGATVGVQSGRVKLARQVVKDDYESGSRYRVDAEIGEVTASLEFDLLFRDASHLQRSFGGASATQPADDALYTAMNLAFTAPVISNAYNQKLALDFPRTWWDRVGASIRGKEGITQRIRATCLYDEASAYLWKATLTNTQTAL